MDGYALKRSEWPGPSQAMKVSQRIAAGSVPRPLEAGTVARIFTGAPVPEGADTVVMQENTTRANDGPVRILELPDADANIRPRGQDIARGDTVINRGARLRAQDLGLIASLGHSEVRCYRRLRVALLSTGDELTEPGQPVAAGKIYNSNRFSVAGLMQSWGFDLVDLGIARDDPDTIRAAFSEAAERADVIVSSGGVSVGEEDHVRGVVESLGSIDLWNIAIKPGKPFAFGQIKATPFIGLPGNPVSVFVTLLIIARPFLMDCQGAVNHEPREFGLPAAFERQGGSREEYLRTQVTPQGLALYPSQSSGVLTSLCRSDGLARQRPGQDVSVGDTLDYFPFESLL
jgi:molybdopterin molybdotransferase